MNKPLTNQQKARLQFLHGVYHGASRIGDQVDPKRRRQTRYDALADIACQEFVAIAGKHPTQVEMHELAIRGQK